MAFNINTFRSELQYGGARSSKFEVILTNPVNSSADTKFSFMCKTASLPGSNMQPVEQSYFGRAVKFPGSRTFDEWGVSIINDEDFKVRNALEEWSNAINSYEGNIRTLPGSSPALYKTTAEVKQYSQVGTVLRTYKFIGLWPMQVAPIQLNWEGEQIEEFETLFSVDYYYVSDNTTGDAGGK